MGRRKNTGGEVSVTDDNEIGYIDENRCSIGKSDLETTIDVDIVNGMENKDVIGNTISLKSTLFDELKDKYQKLEERYKILLDTNEKLTEDYNNLVDKYNKIKIRADENIPKIKNPPITGSKCKFYGEWGAAGFKPSNF